MSKHELVKKWIDDHGMKASFVAKKMGITRSALSRKLSGKRSFTVADIEKLTLIGMTRSELSKIFLP